MPRFPRNAIAAAVAFGLWPGAHAFEIETGVPNLTVRWDTQLRYSAGYRLRDPDAQLSAGPRALNLNDGDLNFRRGLMQNRLDVFTEFDATYNGFGARLSGAGWYDDIYHQGTDNANGLALPPGAFNPNRTLNSGSPGQFSADTRKLQGEKAELLDAFVFGTVNLGAMPLNLRAGRFAQQWGETLFFGANGIAGGMAPVDINKALSSPGLTFKELLRPVGQVAGQLQVSRNLSFGAYYQYKWEKSRLPASGSYFSNNDTLDAGATYFYVPAPPPAPAGTLAPAVRRGDRPAPNTGQWGLQTRFRLPASDVDYGLYAINYHSKLPSAYLRGATYDLVYAENIRAYGASFNTTFGEVNVGGEASIRTNAPLSRGLLAVVGDPLADGGDNGRFPVGRTAHLNLSAIYALPGNFIARENNLTAEVAWNRVLAVTRVGGSAFSTGLDANASRDAFGFRLLYVPTYRQALDGVDLSVPVGLSYSPHGKSGVAGSPFVDKGGDMTLGLSANVQEKVTVALNFTHFYGKGDTSVDNAGYFTFKQSLKDRDFVTLSARMSF